MLSKISIVFSFILLFLTTTSLSFAANPASTNFEIEEYGFGSGGIASASSANFLLYGLTGEVETGSQSSTNFISGLMGNPHIFNCSKIS